MALVSIVLTSYNHAKFIGEAIESVINQTFTDWEMYIFDDASVDDSWNVISQYKDPRIKAIRNYENQGPIYAFNKLIFELAKGEYIAIHHSDDVWTHDKLAKQVQFLNENSQIGAVFTDVLVINEVGSPVPDGSHIYCSIFNQPNRTRYDWLRYFFLNGNALCHPSILIRKQCYSDAGGYRNMLAQLPDFDMWIRLCFHHEVHIMHEKLVKFRVLDNEMNTSGSRQDTRIRCINEHYQLLKQFRALMSNQDVFRVFPDYLALDRGKDTQVDYVLARVCLDSTDYFLRQFLAIAILFELLNDTSKSEVAKELYSFSSKDYIAITGQYDVFGREAILGIQSAITAAGTEMESLRQSLAFKDAKVSALLADLEDKNTQLTKLNQSALVKDDQVATLTAFVLSKEEQIAAILNSTSWKITKPLRYIRRIFNNN